MTDASSLAEAVSGAYGVFAMATPVREGSGERSRAGQDLGDAAAAAGVQHYVYSSVASADSKSGIPHFETKGAIEEHLQGLGLPLTIVRPVYFMETLVTMGAQRTDQGLIVPVPMQQTTKLQIIAVEDIAASWRPSSRGRTSSSARPSTSPATSSPTPRRPRR